MTILRNRKSENLEHIVVYIHILHVYVTVELERKSNSAQDGNREGQSILQSENPIELLRETYLAHLKPRESKAPKQPDNFGGNVHKL